MFGDPVRNDRGWDRPELKKNFGLISTGNTPPRKKPENYSPPFIEWIKTVNIDQNHMYITQASEYLSKTGLTLARTVKKGALLVACIAGSIESIGRAALADRNVAFNQQINAIQPNSDISSIFLYWLFRISKSYIQSFAPKGMKKILTKGNFEKITMIKPPKDMQDRFARIAGKTETIKSSYQIQPH
jgi:type I restriction enzyme S subunit